MELDIRLLISVGAIFVSIASAAAVARYQIGTLLKQISELKFTLVSMDTRLDHNDQSTSNLTHRVDILSDMMSPNTLEKRFRELASLSKDIEYIKERIKNAV